VLKLSSGVKIATESKLRRLENSCYFKRSKSQLWET